ncbi:hypothetical protein [Pedobacter sp.]
MKNFKQIVGLAAIALTMTIAFGVANAKEADVEYKSFKDCWGSGDRTKSCSYDGATVIGCQPEETSYCMGVRDVPE